MSWTVASREMSEEGVELSLMVGTEPLKGTKGF